MACDCDWPVSFSLTPMHEFSLASKVTWSPFRVSQSLCQQPRYGNHYQIKPFFRRRSNHKPNRKWFKYNLRKEISVQSVIVTHARCRANRKLNRELNFFFFQSKRVVFCWLEIKRRGTKSESKSIREKRVSGDRKEKQTNRQWHHRVLFAI